MNSIVGDLERNSARILELTAEARSAEADLVIFPELAVTGYPPEDLLLRPAFIRASRRAVERLAAATDGIVALVGAPHLDADLYNSAFVLAGGEIRGVYRKRFLPNYGVFDENRYFAPGDDLLLLRFGDAIAGVTICEDIWQPGPADDRPGARRCAARREPVVLAVPRRQGPRARGDAARPGARQLVLHRLLQHGRRPGRADLRRDVGRPRRRGRARRAGSQLRRGAARGRSRSRQRGRPTATRCPPAFACARPRRRGPADRDRVPAAESSDLLPSSGSGGTARRPRADAARARARPSRLRGQERVRGRRDRPLGGNRLGADRRGRGRRARAGPGARRLDAVAVLVGGDAGRRRACSPDRSESSSARSRSKRWSRRSAARSRPRSPAASPI